jgi:hypothetical protein
MEPRGRGGQIGVSDRIAAAVSAIFLFIYMYGCSVSCSCSRVGRIMGRIGRWSLVSAFVFLKNKYRGRKAEIETT